MTQEPPLGDAPAGHLDLDTLAELEEGLLPAADAAGYEAHLRGCRQCREHRARLRSTRALLAALPAEPIPAAVAERIDAALTGAAATATVVPFDARRRGWRSHPTAAGLGAAAAAVALITAVVVGSSLHSSSKKPGTAQPLAGAAPSQVESNPNFPTQIGGRHYNPANAKDLVTAVALSAAGPRSAAGTATSPTTRAQGVTVAPKVPAALQTLYSDRDALLRCAAALAGPNPAVPIAVDFGRYTDAAKHVVNTPVVVILLPGPTGKIDGWIVGPNCATAADNNIYLFERITQPS